MDLEQRVGSFVDKLKSIQRKETVLFESQSRSNILRSGLPKEGSYEIIRSTGDETFRHFTTIENIKKIKESRKLIAGHMPSSRNDGYYEITYGDVTGVFMTTKEIESSGDLFYIDFKIPKGISIIKMNEFRGEYVIPGARNWKPWFLDYINKSPEKYEGLLKYLQKNSQGLLVPKDKALEVPIEILGSSD